ncbi:MAG: phosphoenolpyruvate-utilizing N-terminal domain-containing protein, partial [Clostridia bacterium]|nr:phosphoenolpyruvate-utilizing N-terminal domain-containing protein [Clostridia bacterium]
MLKFNGKGVYGAIAIGKISVFKRQEAQIRRVHITDTAAELTRVDAAKEKAIAQLSEIYEKALKEVGETNAQIFEIHMMMIEDDDYNESIRNIITNQSVNAEYAIALTSDNFAAMFAAMSDAYMQARAADVKDISNRIIACMTESDTVAADSDEKVIICADDLAPSETVSLDKDRVLAFVTAHGSSNSHTAILARNMNIPAVIGVGDAFLAEINDGDLAAVDGFTGEIFVNADDETLAAMKAKQKADLEKKELLKTLKGKENITLDGTKINIYANIGGVENIG